MNIRYGLSSKELIVAYLKVLQDLPQFAEKCAELLKKAGNSALIQIMCVSDTSP
jgi:hypothetical protein